MRGIIELDENFWKINVKGKIKIFSDLDRALEDLRNELIKEGGRWGRKRRKILAQEGKQFI